jgi:glutathione synthase/RimK-type ligase-like ATP-grasp enzyme
MLTEGRFIQMIRRYGAVIVKPAYSSGGFGVMKAAQVGRGRISVHWGTRYTVYNHERAAFNYIKRCANGRAYVVQRYVPLIKIEGRPVDFRVMIQRKPKGSWTATGKLGKVAGSNHIITNVARSKGYILPAKSALHKTGLGSKAPAILERMNHIGLRAAKQLGMAYGFRNIGFDMAVDRQGGTWILECNSVPALSMFLKLKDRSLYKRIISYK